MLPAEPASIDEDPDGIVEVRAAAGGALSLFEPNGLTALIVPQPATQRLKAIAVSLRPARVHLLGQFLSGDMIDGCSIIVVGVCPRAGVGIICRVSAAGAAKRVTIPAQTGPGRPDNSRHCPLSYSIKSKI
jgi:hypothetical protein